MSEKNITLFTNDKLSQANICNILTANLVQQIPYPLMVK